VYIKLMRVLFYTIAVDLTTDPNKLVTRHVNSHASLSKEDAQGPQPIFEANLINVAIAQKYTPHDDKFIEQHKRIVHFVHTLHAGSLALPPLLKPSKTKPDYPTLTPSTN
jgi:hypothetical protein